jgi:hypothetical protein
LLQVPELRQLDGVLVGLDRGTRLRGLGGEPPSREAAK